MLLDMNDDCIEIIFHYLTLDELMGMYGELHDRIDAAIERQMHRFRHYEVNMREPPRYGKLKLELLGGYLHSLFINVGYSIRPEYALAILHPLIVGAAKSGRLRALRIQHVIWTRDYVDAVLLVSPQLRVLDVSRCDLTELQLKPVLESATKLHTLVLLNVCKLKADILTQGSILKELRILKLNKFLGPLNCCCENLCELHKQLSIVVYHTPECLEFKIFGRNLNIQPNDNWHHEYCQNEIS